MVISYKEFKQNDIRVVEVVNAESIPQKTRILKLTIDVGEEKTRSIIAGGAEFYSPEFFIGKKFVAIINLAPKNIAGIKSQGMLLAAVSDDKPYWLIVDKKIPTGAKVI